MQTDLDDLPARIQAGEAGAFRWLVEALGPRLVRVAARLVGDVQLAEDVVQESFLKAYRAMTGGRFEERARVDTWLYRIVINGALDVRRRHRRVAPAAVAPEPAAAPYLEAHLALRELAAWLEELPAAQRAALVLSALEGLSQQEIATIQGCSEGAVEQRLVRARAALRQKGAPR